MKTIEQLKQNANKCWSLMRELDAQIQHLENDFQSNFIATFGERSKDFDAYIKSLTEAKAALNAVAHMNLNDVDYLMEEAAGEE